MASEVVDKANVELIDECGMYLIPASNPERGRGLVAGQFIDEDVEINRSVVLMIHNDDFHLTQLSNYVFGTAEGDISIAQLGLDMLYNHKATATVKRTWAPGDDLLFVDQVLAHATHTEVLTTTKKNVSGQ